MSAQQLWGNMTDEYVKNAASLRKWDARTNCTLPFCQRVDSLPFLPNGFPGNSGKSRRIDAAVCLRLSERAGACLVNSTELLWPQRPSLILDTSSELHPKGPVSVGKNHIDKRQA